MRTPLQGFGHLQRVYGTDFGSHIARKLIISTHHGYTRGIQSIYCQPRVFQQVKVKWASQINSSSHRFCRASSSITGHIDEKLLFNDERSTSVEQNAQDVRLFIRHSVDALGQMRWEDMTKLIANIRLDGGIRQRAESFEEVLASFNTEQADALRELSKSTIESSRNQLNSSVWLCYINILAHCKNWEDVMIELHANGFSEGHIVDGMPERSRRPKIPAFVLEHAFTMIRNSHQASEACALFNNNLDSLSISDAIKIHQSLKDFIMNELQATYLSGSLTTITIRIASRLVSTSKMEIHQNVCMSSNGQIEALKLVRKMIQSFLPWPFGHIRRHVQKLLNWADFNLSLDHCDTLRMQILGCESADDEMHLPWQNILWAPSSHRSFSTSNNALGLINRLYENKRYGAGMQFALQAALYVAVRSQSRFQSAKLVRQAERSYKLKRISVAFFKSIIFLEELVMTGQKERALQLFDIILSMDKELGNSTKIKVWATILGMLANTEDSPDVAIRLIDINDGSESWTKFSHLPIQRPPAEVLSKPFVYARVIQQIALRADANYADHVKNIWNLMLARDIKPDLHCLEEYCLGLIRQGRIEDALSILDEWSVKLKKASQMDDDYIPRSGFIYRMMKSMIEQGETQKVYHLYLEILSKKQSESDVYLLPTLLRAAEKVSVKQEERGYSDNHPIIARMLFQRTDPLKSKTFLWDGIPAPLRARQIFRQALFDSYPDLRDLPSPLDDLKIGKRGSLWKGEIRMQKFEEWLSHKLSFENGNGQKERFTSLMRNSSNAQSKKINNPLETNHGNDKVQRVMLQCTHDLFENYLRLLPFVEIGAREIGMGSREMEELQIGWGERLIVLSWMRYLDIFPNKSCLCLICTYIQESMPPVLEGMNVFANRNTNLHQDPYSDANYSAAGPLHGFLADWIGEENIPTNQDVAIFMRSNFADDKQPPCSP